MIVRNWMMQGGISSLYLTIDNTGNYYPLVNDQIEFTLLSSEIDFTKILSDVSNLIIMDGATVLKHYIDYNDYANGIIKGFVKCSVNAKSSKSLTVLLTGTSNLSSYTDTMIRATSHCSMLNFYPFSSVNDSLAIGEAFTLNNAQISTIGVGSALDLSGTTSYAISNIFNLRQTRAVSDYGFLMFNFILKTTHIAGGGVKTIFSKYFDTNNYIYFGLNDSGQFYTTLKVGGATQSWTSTTVRQLAGAINSFAIRYTNNAVFIRVNGVTVLTYDPVWIVAADGLPLTFGAQNNGSYANYFDGYIYDFSIHNMIYPFNYEIGRTKNMSLNSRTQKEKWQYRGHTDLNGCYDVSEYTYIYANGVLYGYGKEYTAATGISIAVRKTSYDDGSTWSERVVLFGNGAGGENNQVHRGCCFIGNDGLYHYCYSAKNTSVVAINNKLRCCDSVDGVTFTNFRDILNPFTGATGGIENSRFIWDAALSTYIGFVDVGGVAGVAWSEFYVEGETLDTLGYYHEGAETSLQIAGGMYGASCIKKIGNEYYVWEHISLGAGSIIPTQAYCFKSSNPRNNSWQLVDEILAYDVPRCRDQWADLYICENTDKNISILSADACKNYGSLELQSSIFTYNGLLTDLVKDTISSISKTKNDITVIPSIAIDVDAQVFITAAGLTGNDITSIDLLCKRLKENKLWERFPYIWPFIGGSAATNKFQLKRPVDSDDANRLTFYGSFTHNANGLIPSGASGTYADPHLTVKSLYYNNYSFIYVSPINISTGTNYGTDIATAGGGNVFRTCYQGSYLTNMGGQAANYASQATSKGVFIASAYDKRLNYAMHNRIIRASNTTFADRVFGGAALNLFCYTATQQNAINPCSLIIIGLGLDIQQAIKSTDIFEEYMISRGLTI